MGSPSREADFLSSQPWTDWTLVGDTKNIENMNQKSCRHWLQTKGYVKPVCSNQWNRQWSEWGNSVFCKIYGQWVGSMVFIMWDSPSENRELLELWTNSFHFFVCFHLKIFIFTAWNLFSISRADTSLHHSEDNLFFFSLWPRVNISPLFLRITFALYLDSQHCSESYHLYISLGNWRWL